MSDVSTSRLIRTARFGAPLYYGGLCALGVPALTRRLREEGLILCYHNVVPANAGKFGEPSLHLSSERFQRQMRWLAARYSVLTLHEFVSRLLAGKSMRSIAAVTFDDGYAGVFEHAVPILRALSIPATVFVVAGAVGRSSGFWWDQPEIIGTSADRHRPLSELRGDGDAMLAGRASLNRVLPPWYRPARWDTIRERSGGGIEIGVHSATHRSLPTLADSELDHEIVESRAIIREATGNWPEFFAYPYGHWNSHVRDRVRSAGYLAGLTLDSGLNQLPADPWSLRRVNVPARISDAAFEAWAAGFHWRRG
jgi:peptidoglycan/xylan/chitin deacetylase (PgdA/CDA1 family)